MYNYWIILPCYSKINSRNWIHNNYIHFDQGSPLIAKKVQCLRPSIICNNHNYVTSGVQNQVEVTVRCTWFVSLVRKFNRYLPMIVVFPIKSWSLPLPITKSGLYLSIVFIQTGLLKLKMICAVNNSDMSLNWGSGRHK